MKRGEREYGEVFLVCLAGHSQRNELRRPIVYARQAKLSAAPASVRTPRGVGESKAGSVAQLLAQLPGRHPAPAAQFLFLEREQLLAQRVPMSYGGAFPSRIKGRRICRPTPTGDMPPTA
jgi:hypothetical protein